MTENLELLSSLQGTVRGNKVQKVKYPTINGCHATIFIESYPKFVKGPNLWQPTKYWVGITNGIKLKLSQKSAQVYSCLYQT